MQLGSNKPNQLQTSFSTTPTQTTNTAQPVLKALILTYPKRRL